MGTTGLRFVLAGFLEPRDGYGYGTIKIGEALRRLLGDGVEVVDLRHRRGFDVPVVAVCTPDWLPAIKAPAIVAHTMFEATRLPVGISGHPWGEILNTHAAAVVVPCAWNVDVFAANGVRRPIRVARWGIDPADYYPLARTAEGDHKGRPYRFLWSGTPDRRKGWDVAYRAFRSAFGNREDVTLTMHFRKLLEGLRGSRDSNVEVVEGVFDRPELRAMLRAADCYVFPSRGEGWGLPPREAAATGLPVIATDFGGLAEEIGHWALSLRTAGMSRAEYGFWEGDLGEWAEPDGEHLAELMLWCVENREAAATFGREAGAWLAVHGTWERTARAIVEAVQEVPG